jgi:hypothetical protein
VPTTVEVLVAARVPTHGGCGGGGRGGRVVGAAVLAVEVRVVVEAGVVVVEVAVEVAVEAGVCTFSEFRRTAFHGQPLMGDGKPASQRGSAVISWMARLS